MQLKQNKENIQKFELEVAEYKINLESARIYNTAVDEVIQKINSLKLWNDYIPFEDVNYGLPEFLDDIHRNNDCGGDMKETSRYYESCRCSSCENWLFGCSNPNNYYLVTLTCTNCGDSTSKHIQV